MALDNFFKNLFKNLFAGAVETGISVGTLDKQIDLILYGDNPKIKHSKMIDLIKTPKMHILEFKRHRDPYSKRDMTKLIGYGVFYAENKEYGPSYSGIYQLPWNYLISWLQANPANAHSGVPSLIHFQYRKLLAAILRRYSISPSSELSLVL